MRPVWVHSAGVTHEILNEAVFLSQPQKRMLWVRVMVLGVIGMYLY